MREALDDAYNRHADRSYSSSSLGNGFAIARSVAHAKHNSGETKVQLGKGNVQLAEPIKTITSDF